MKTRYILFRRDNGVYYTEDTTTGKQSSLRTKEESEARRLLAAKNEAQRQPVLNLHLARAYLTASDPAFVERTWQTVMEQLQSRGKDSSRERYTTVFKSTHYDALRNKKLLETTADDFFAVFKTGKPSIINFLKRLHNFAVTLGWIALPIVAPYLWPKYEPKERRGITRDEQEAILTHEKKAEWKLYLELLWETGAAQSDAVNFKAEDVDWQTRTISYFRQKTGSLAQFTISKKLEIVLSHLPTTGVLFPNLSKFTANDRASRFRRRCHKAGVTGVTLHCYRYRRVLNNDDAVDALLGNLQAKFFCQNTGATNKWASEQIIGERWVKITGTNAGQSHTEATLNNPEIQASHNGGISRSEQRRFFVEPAAFATLRRGGALHDFQVEAIVYNGGHLFANGREWLPYRKLTFNQK